MESPYISAFSRLGKDAEYRALRINQLNFEGFKRFAASFTPFLKKQTRCFQRCISGLIRAMNLGLRTSFMTLTSGKGFPVSELLRCFQVLRKRVFHRWGFLMEYLGVRTSEGNGVLHVLFIGGYIDTFWLSEAWRSITMGISYIVDIREVHLGRKADCKRMARYMTQYVAGQEQFERFSYSWKFLFRGAVRVWRSLVADFGVSEAILRFERILSHSIVTVAQGSFDVLGSLVLSGVPYRVLGG